MDEVVEGELGWLFKIKGMQNYLPVVTWLEGDPNETVNGHGKYKAVIIICVFTNQVDTTRRANDELGRFSKVSLEGSGEVFKFHRARGSDAGVVPRG